jgi:hypothetical protein
MHPILDDVPYDAAAPSPRHRSSPSRHLDLPDLPDLHDRPRRLHPMLTAGLAFTLAAVAFYGAEAALPVIWRPSHFVGGYSRQIEEARKSGELAATARYAPRLKQIETAAVQMQEQCKAQLQGVNTYLQAVYNRAGVGFQLAADMQRQYMSVRYSTTQQTLGGEIGAANLATSFGFIASLFDPELARQSMEFAENARQQALARIDQASKGGVQISVDGWDAGLTDPATFMGRLHCEMPSLAEPVPQPSSEG